MAQPGRRIEPGWRYTLAQFVLWLLYGRKWHYISPWPNAGAGGALVVFWKDSLLLHQRRGHIEGVGKWGFNGGYMDFDKGEDFPTAIEREFYEETGVHFDKKCLIQPFYLPVVYHAEKILISNYTTIGCWFAVEAEKDILPLLQETEEAHNFKWFNKATYDALYKAGDLVSEENYKAGLMAFALREKETLPKLKLL